MYLQSKEEQARIDQQIIDDLLQLFSKIQRQKIIEENYFTKTIPQDAIAKQLIAKDVQELRIGAWSREWDLPCIFTGSGAGKTFIATRAADLVKDHAARHPHIFPSLQDQMTNVFHLYLKQSGEFAYSSFVERLQSSTIKADMDLYMHWHIASQLLGSKDSELIHTSPDSIHSRVEELSRLKGQNYEYILRAMKQLHGINESPVWIFFVHEDMQSLTHYSELHTLGDSFSKQRSSAIYQYIMEAVHLAQAAKYHGINVVNIFTGTYPINEASIFTATQNSFSPLQLDPLTLEDGISLLTDKHPELADQFQLPEFRYYLLSLGNIPGLWKELSMVITDHNWSSTKAVLDTENMSKIAAKFEQRVADIYKTDHCELLSLLAVQGWSFARARYYVLPKPEAAKVDELCNAGLLFTKKDHFFVPPVILQALSPANEKSSLKTLYSKYSRKMWSGLFTAEDVEQFCLDFFELKRSLMASVGLEEISAYEFLEGALIDYEWCKETLSLTLADAKKMRKYSAEKNQYSMILLKDSCIQFKVKYFDFKPTQAEVLSTFAAEQKKAAIRSGNLRNDSLKDLFVYVTNCHMTLTDEVKAVQHICSAIIPANCFERVFGPAFDLMRPFIMAEQEHSSEDKNKAKPQQRRNNKRKQDEVVDKLVDDSVEAPKKKAKK